MPIVVIGLVALWLFSSASGLPWALRLALDRAGLEDIRFAKASFSEGRIIVEGIETGGAAALTIERLEAEIGAGTVRRQRIGALTATGVRGTVTLGGGGAASFAIPPIDDAKIDDVDITIRGEGFAVALSGALDARQTSAGYVVTSREARLRSLAEPAWFVPLRLDAEVKVTSPSDPIAIIVKGTDDGGALAFEVAGPFALGEGETRLAAKLFPLVLIDEVRPIEQLFPIAKRFVDKVAGTIEADAVITGKPARNGRVMWNGTATAQLRQVDVTAGGVAVEGIETVLNFSQLAPFALAKEQTVSVRRVVLGLPFENIVARFTLSPQHVLDLRALEARLAEGMVRAAPLTLALDRPEIETTLTVEQVSLAALLAVAAVDGLSGEGSLDGTLPTATRGGVLTITQGVLAAAEPGVLRYQPKAEPGAPAAEGQMAMLRQVLTDFRYKELKMQVDGAIGGEQSVVVRLVGSNPSFYDGYPVAFTLNLSGALEAIVRRGVSAYAIPNTLRTNIERLQKGNQQ